MTKEFETALAVLLDQQFRRAGAIHEYHTDESVKEILTLIEDHAETRGGECALCERDLYPDPRDD